MTKFTKDKKLAIIQGYDPDLLSQTEYANQMGVTRSHFQYWLKLYELHVSMRQRVLSWTYSLSY
ncbi:transposase [Paenibacillus vortex V453]|uniref:Transposase n=1 Tax=Paenibacillus vortex V453 TaxID=715225 RepID=A0A2R9ST52_9BACL|nr:transposase [Paenibacillus vortex V453]